jgi:cell division transport system ATP-binding protein
VSAAAAAAANEAEQAAARPRTAPLDIVDVQLDELGLADRLGLDDSDDEVGPTR